MIQPAAKLLSYFSFKVLCMYTMCLDHIYPSLSTSNSLQHLLYYLLINFMLSFKNIIYFAYFHFIFSSLSTISDNLF